MFNFLRKPKCFSCEKPLGEDYAEIRYGDIDEMKSVNICKECADALERGRVNDKDSI